MFLKIKDINIKIIHIFVRVLINNKKTMKNLRNKVLAFFAQAYANFLIFQLENCKSAYEYEILMTQAVTLDYVCSEEFGFDLN